MIIYSLVRQVMRKERKYYEDVLQYCCDHMMVIISIDPINQLVMIVIIINPFNIVISISSTRSVCTRFEDNTI